jgi:hypothetical protein
MAQVELIHSQGTYQVSCIHLITKCDLFKNNPGLTLTPYQVQSEVSLEDFQDFISAFEAKSIKINDTNLPRLLQLSEEFCFQMLLLEISNRQRLPGLSEVQRMKYPSQIASLEGQVGQHEHQLAALHMMLLAAVRRFETDLERLGSELKAVRDTKNTEAATTNQSRCKKSPPPAVPSVRAQPVRLDSLIVSEYPPLFEAFRMKRWAVLWRVSCDGFTTREFHRRCDGHANTLTIILDTDGNVFGDFTPVKWELRTGYPWSKGDDSLQSFLFTLRNPYGVPPRKFALNKERKEYAIYYRDDLCAVFGYHTSYYCSWDIGISDTFLSEPIVVIFF